MPSTIADSVAIGYAIVDDVFVEADSLRSPESHYNDSATFLMRSERSSKPFLKFVNSSSVVVIFL